METVRFGVIGLGNMGAPHAKNLDSGMIAGARLTAACDINPEKLKWASKDLSPDVQICSDYHEMLSGGKVDAVLISTPHYLHPVIGIDAFEMGLHVLSEKPIGVYTKKVEEFMAAAEKSGKVFGVMYNQRTSPLYQKVRDMVQGGELGELKRCVWIITDWYRTQSYYDSGGWRATWEGEGGGVLLNQAPHNLDLWQWIFGMPTRITAFLTEGKYHNIEVEDDVTAYAEYPNGATGVFITTTGEYPGTNRLEISGDRGKIVVGDNYDKIRFTKLAVPEREHCFLAPQGFSGPEKEELEIAAPTMPGVLYNHPGIIQNFTNAILNGEELLAPGSEGIRGLSLSNAMFLSSWLNKPVDLPIDGDLFYQLLGEKIKNSKKKKVVIERNEDLEGTYGL